MKKAFVLVMAVLLLITAISLVSAKTLVAGKIYNSDFTSIVEGAIVQVTCIHNGVNSTNVTLSNSDGAYSAIFSESPMECTYNDTLSVHAFKAGVGENTVSGIVSIDKDVIGLDVNIGIVNVPLIPEFGIIAGAIAVIGAVGIFFFVRRK